MTRYEAEIMSVLVHQLIGDMKRSDRMRATTSVEKVVKTLLSTRTAGRAVARADKRYTEILRLWMHHNSLLSEEEMERIVRRVNGEGVHTRIAADSRMFTEVEPLGVEAPADDATEGAASGRVAER
jgi:hypothetical protein